MSTNGLENNTKAVSKLRLTIVAVLGAVAFYNTFGNHVIPVAGWLMPIAFVFLVRHTRLRWGIPVAWAIMSSMWLLAFRGLAGAIPLPVVIGVGILYGGPFLVPFLIDRYCHRRIDGFAVTLVLPAAAAATDYLITVTSLYGSWGSAAYSQYGNLAIVQLVAWTGLPGIVFLLYWTGSIFNWALEQDFEWSRIRRGSLAYATVLVTVVTAGSLRTVVAAPSGDTLRVASISVPKDELITAIQAREAGNESDPYPDAVRKAAEHIQDEYLARTAREAEAGATFVVWPEAGCLMRKEDEAAYVERARALADEHDIYLFMGLGVSLKSDPPQLENKVVTVGPEGDILDEYHKTFVVPGDTHGPGDGILPLIDTPYGRVSVAICYDMDFPGLIRQAGKGDADIIIAPSNDWPGIDPIHTMMATFRAVENGAAVIRQTSSGLSIAVDHQGRVLASADYFQTDDHTMVASIPKESPGSLYAKVGDVFAWAMVITTLASMGFAALKTSTVSSSLSNRYAGPPEPSRSPG